MNATTQTLTSRRSLDRSFWHAFRCAIGWHVPAAFELREFSIRRKEGRKEVEYSVWLDVQEAICCGKVLESQRVA